MASSSTTHLYNLKLSKPEIRNVFEIVFNEKYRILGDKPRLRAGRGKPAPDIYLLALNVTNENLEHQIKPEECLVFEDSIPGVEAGRRAGMRVAWVPHPKLKAEYEGREQEVLAGRTSFGKLDDEELKNFGDISDRWSCYLESLVDFPYQAFGIDVKKASD